MLLNLQRPTFSPVRDESVLRRFGLAGDGLRPRLDPFAFARRRATHFYRHRTQEVLPLVQLRRLRSGEVDVDEIERAIFSVPSHYAAHFLGVPFSVVATSSTAKTVVGAQCAAQIPIRVFGYNLGFDGVNSGQGNAICEFCHTTFATNPPGTNSTSVTLANFDDGRPETAQTTGGKNWTTEPTVITVTETAMIPVYMGSAIVFVPLTTPFVAKGGSGASVRVTQQSGVTGNAGGALKIEE
jgi:hypothetical protein